MAWLFAVRLLCLIALLAAFGLPFAAGQSDPDEIPLGDVARNLRKKTPAAKPVIDDDNLPPVMQEGDAHHGLGPGLRYLLAGSHLGFHVEAPDVTCSLSFTASVKSLLSDQFAEMQLPPGEMEKIDGRAVLEGDALTIPVFNGTQWHLSEITVAFTVIRKGRSGIGATGQDIASGDAAPELESDTFQQVRPEKKPDLTAMYRMRAAGLPWSNVVFSAPLNLEPAAGEEWHWAIVQAKGYPPETYVSRTHPLPLKPPMGEQFVPSHVSLKSSDPQNADPIPAEPHQ